MHRRLILALFLMTAAIGPASAQLQGGGVPTETEARQTEANPGYDLFWNVIGIIGLLGLIGLLPKHEEDSYHPSSIE
jgi:UPF0716 family protein affecting phage T7 exclusion